MAQPYGFRCAGGARCNEHKGKLVDMPGRIFRPRHFLALIQTMGIDAWNCMTGFSEIAAAGLTKPTNVLNSFSANFASSKTATAPHDQTASRSATKPALLP